jgi:hypothetical protein
LPVIMHLMNSQSVILRAPPGWGKTVPFFIWLLIRRRLYPDETFTVIVLAPLSAVFDNHVAVADKINTVAKRINGQDGEV